MSNYPVGRRPRSADPHSALRLAALTAVAAGVVLLAAAAFVLSYPGIHSVALQAGVTPNLAKLYPVIFDAMLVVAGAAAIALRGAGWWSRFYAWACLIGLLAAVAVGDAVHATGTVLPERATRAAVAVTPWVLLLLAFGLLLTMLRHFRKSRAAVVARQEARAAAATGADTGSQPAQANGTVTGRAPVTWATAGTAALAASAAGTAAVAAGPAAAPANSAAGTAGTATATEARPLPPRFGLDFWLGPRQGQAPAIGTPYEADLADAEEDASHDDPVSYGEETGYVHPDSYRDEGEYSPHGDSGGPGTYTGSGDSGQDEPPGHGDSTPQDGTAEGNGEGTAPAAPAVSTVPAAATAQADEADVAEADKADAVSQDGKDTATPQDGKDAASQDGKADAAAPQAKDAASQNGKADAAAPEAKDAASQDGKDAVSEEGKADAVSQADATSQEGNADASPDSKADTEPQEGPAGAPVEEDKAGAATANGSQAGQPAQDASGEMVAAQGPGLERVRSSPTRPG
jgi:hypothetical protein